MFGAISRPGASSCAPSGGRGAAGAPEDAGRDRHRRVLEQRPQRLVPAPLDLGVEVDERDEAPAGGLGAAVAAGAEADVLVEAHGARALPVTLDVLPAAVDRARID